MAYSLNFLERVFSEALPAETEEFGPPTGRQLEQEGITIHLIEDGKIVEEWERYDNLSILQQLGLAPEQE